MAKLDGLHIIIDGKPFLHAMERAGQLAKDNPELLYKIDEMMEDPDSMIDIVFGDVPGIENVTVVNPSQKLIDTIIRYEAIK